jgi:hypothetical protein
MTRRVRWFLLAGCAAVCALYAPISGRLARQALSGPYAGGTGAGSATAEAEGSAVQVASQVAGGGARPRGAGAGL